ncbi:MAG TPA: fasciclin domain-containing protein, partial [Candidatus Nanopelagicales bacterium]|nr:fasciclin domain-containing protein [Candidatus Nanopelagicales bacterium]
MRTAFEPSFTPPSSERVRVVRVGDRRLPDAGWLETVDITTAIDHLPGARWFLSVLAASELADDLRSAATWTVLVPTDTAIARLPGDAADRVFLPDESEALIDLAEHHVAR